MGLLRSYLKSMKPYTKDDRRRDFQKQQWRNRIDAQMRAAKRPASQAPVIVQNGVRLYRFPCQNCGTELLSPATRETACPKCGFRMYVKAVRNSHTVGPADSASTRTKRTASPTSELERLAKLHRSGTLTDEEFARAKASVLARF